MTPIDNGGPAFPVASVQNANGEIQWGFDGMFLRDWLAKEGAKIHAEGLLAIGCQPSSRWDEVCREGLRFADAMLAARKEGA
jgi:hypothetical protein